jgi:hypothetical protein
MTDQTDTTPATRRQVLAFLALADAPAPLDIRFNEAHRMVNVQMESFAAASALRQVIGGDWWAGNEFVHTHATDGAPRLSGSWHLAGWRGWLLIVDAEDPVPAAVDGDLDADTRDQLATIAAGGAR